MGDEAPSFLLLLGGMWAMKESKWRETDMTKMQKISHHGGQNFIGLFHRYVLARLNLAEEGHQSQPHCRDQFNEIPEPSFSPVLLIDS